MAKDAARAPETPSGGCSTSYRDCRRWHSCRYILARLSNHWTYTLCLSLIFKYKFRILINTRNDNVRRTEQTHQPRVENRKAHASSLTSLSTRQQVVCFENRRTIANPPSTEAKCSHQRPTLHKPTQKIPCCLHSKLPTKAPPPSSCFPSVKPDPWPWQAAPLFSHF